MQLAQMSGIDGTAAFVFGHRLIPGAASLDQFRAVIEQARSRARAE